MRAVSLLPSATEMLYALGVEPVGVSHECDHPPAARAVPAVTDTRIDADASGAEVDAQVRAVQESGEGVYELDRERLAALDPDLIVSQGLCEVCAVESVAVREAVEALQLEADVLTIDPHSIGDVLDAAERLGAALDRANRAAGLRRNLQARIDAVATDSAGVDRRRVAVLDWLEPPMVAGHWIPELVELAGGAYGLAEPEARSRPREWAAIRAYDPEVLIAAPCGFEVPRTLADATALTDRPGWRDLAAIQRDAVYAMDGHHYVNRPGPRLVDTLELLADVIGTGAPTADVAAVRPLEPA